MGPKHIIPDFAHNILHYPRISVHEDYACSTVIKEICTFLQCKVHLSMFHSSPTSKIWYTSTKHEMVQNPKIV
jgi:hypothetical protein